VISAKDEEIALIPWLSSPEARAKDIYGVRPGETTEICFDIFYWRWRARP
jgi:hypothetical protein